MHARSGPARPRTSRIAAMSARQRRSELAAIIGPDRYYREVFDPYEPPEEGEVTANLADDIARLQDKAGMQFAVEAA